MTQQTSTQLDQLGHTLTESREALQRHHTLTPHLRAAYDTALRAYQQALVDEINALTRTGDIED